MKQISIKKVNKKDIRFLFNSYNTAVKNKFFFSKKKISYDNHKKWFFKTIKTNKIKIFILKKKNLKIGYIKFDLISSNAALISIFVKKNYNNKSYASYLLNKSMLIMSKKTGIKFFYAIVLKKNTISQNFFLKNKFKLFNKKMNFLKKNHTDKIYIKIIK